MSLANLFSGCFCWLVCCDLPAFPGLFGPCTNGVFTAYAHVRTEPQCDIGHTRKKKMVVSVGALAPFAVCFAVLGMVRRKSGRGICVLPFGCGVLCLGVYALLIRMRPPVSMLKFS